MVNTPRTSQQKNLVPKSLDTITDPVDESDADEEDDSSLFADESEPNIDLNFYKKVSITVSSSMKLRDVFVQLAKQADVNVFIPQNVEGGISFDAKNRAFIDIVKDICGSCYLKYTINGNSIKIENDTPSTKIYDLQFLNIQRETQSSVAVSTDLFMNQNITKNGVSGASLTDGKDNGSKSVVSGLIKNDFWTELEQNLKNIVGEDGTVTVHRQGGLITVYAPQFKQEEVQKYINLLKETAESQVLIEAKILEVDLNDEFKNGINWNILRNGGATLTKDYSDRTGLISFGMNRANLNIVAGIAERFGAVKTLSSPRITVLNNQSAILKVARNEIIYIPELQRQYGGLADSRGSDFLSNALYTIPVGLIISVQPSIDIKNKTVILNLRPTISRINREKEVPYSYQVTDRNSVGLFQNGVQTQKIPIIDVREMDSVLKLKSGQVAVMGGLMREKSSNNRGGLPGADELDFIAGENEKSTDVTELVIFLKATIVKNKNRYHGADKKLYEKFANDPRPLRLKK